MMHLQKHNSRYLLPCETTDVSRYVQPANTGWYAFVRRVWGLVLVAWRQYKCPMSGRVLIDFRNGISGERLTAMQMYPRNCNVRSMLRRLKDLMFCLTFSSGKQCIANAYEFCIYHEWVWPSKCDVDGENSETPEHQLVRSEHSVARTSGLHWRFFLRIILLLDANHRGKVMT